MLSPTINGVIHIMEKSIHIIGVKTVNDTTEHDLRAITKNRKYF